MNSMKSKLVSNMKQGVAKVVGDVAIKVGNQSTEAQCIGFSYEPEVPKELLMKDRLDK
ncbi:cyclic lactone autoinducer peptide [Gracilibacillus alcaliphilus]|uniref:cyclic lactone autoinducer peptide n=1 Tax=Gracilibacillus alcaliphilus TaxID=1401441 RepID=UPI00195B048C|nr:cyclic lactone autoinducer peptide [Gracilibacillus alcaliphilus]MBM7676059.1 cyclic lactone autoinducer peptide [Gracilibacillus alcaliphilus]